MALLLGIIFGVAVAVVVVVLVSCFHCSCCLLYKKRQPSTRGTVYQMHCPSNASGVANMYSFSRTPTPSDTPRSISRCSSSSRSRMTVGSGPSIISNSRYDLADIRERHELLPPAHNYSSVSVYSRPGSIALSDRSANTASDTGTVRENLAASERMSIPCNHLEPPPPYGAPHSTLVAVRTPSAFHHQPIPRPRTPPSLHVHADDNEAPFPSNLGENNAVAGSSQLRTFAQVPAPSSVSSATTITALPGGGRVPPPMRIVTHTQTPSQQLPTPVRRAHNLTNPTTQNDHFFRHFHDSFSNPTYNLNQPIMGAMTSSLAHTARPCSASHTTHILAPHHNSTIDDRRLFTATKF